MRLDCAAEAVGAMKVVMADPNRVTAATRLRKSRRPLENVRLRSNQTLFFHLEQDGIETIDSVGFLRKYRCARLRAQPNFAAGKTK